MDISVVIPTFNSEGEVAACLASVDRALPEAEVVIVDNDSADRTIDVVRLAHPEATVLSGHGNVGFGRACNLGAKRASNRLILFLNPDSVILNVDYAGIEELGRDRTVGLIGGTLVDAGRSIVSARASYRRSWVALFLTDHCLGLLLPRTVLDRGRVRKMNGQPGAGAVSGAVCLVSAMEFDTMGGFDERFFMYYEDTDLARRYVQAGYPVRSSTLLTARHSGGSSAGAHRLLALSFLAWLEYTAKWYGPPTARRAAILAKAFYSAVLSCLSAVERLTDAKRACAKVAQLRAMLSIVASGGMSPDGRGDGYPVASPLAMEIFAAFRP